MDKDFEDFIVLIWENVNIVLVSNNFGVKSRLSKIIDIASKV